MNIELVVADPDVADCIAGLETRWLPKDRTDYDAADDAGKIALLLVECIQNYAVNLRRERAERDLPPVEKPNVSRRAR